MEQRAYQDDHERDDDRETEAWFADMRRGGLWRLGLVMVVLIGAIVGYVLLTERTTTATFVGVRDVTKSFDSYVGETVTVSGVVSEVIGPRAFVLKGAGVQAGQILVVGGHDMSAVVDQHAIAPKQNVRVTGEVRRFEPASFGFGYADDLGKHSGRPAMVASRVFR